MPWTLEAGEAGARLALTGMVDICEAEAFHAALVGLARGGGDVLVDVSACAGLDTSAIQLLLALREALDARGGRLLLSAGSGPVARLLAQLQLF